MRQLKTRLSDVWGRRLLIALTGLYFFIGIALLGLRYGAPRLVDGLRPTLEAQWSKAAGGAVHIGGLSLHWRGWEPILDVRQVQLRSSAGQDLLRVPLASVQLNWTRIFAARPVELSVQARGLDLRVRRDLQGGLHAFGQVFHPGDLEDELPDWLGRLLLKPRLQLLDTTLRWQDAQRQAPELVLQGADIRLQSAPDGDLMVHAALSLPGVPGGAAHFNAALPPVSQWPAKGAWDHVRANLVLNEVSPAGLRPWVDMPGFLGDDPISLQAWVQRKGAHALRFTLQTRGISLREGAWFESTLRLGSIGGLGTLDWAHGVRLRLDQLRWHNADIDAEAAGSWQPGGAAGQVDLEGTIARARLAAIHRYLPKIVDEEARDWLRQGLQAGLLQDARLVLRGDLAQFPFGEHPDAGDFLVEGPYQHAQVDYVPALPDEPSWPRLRDMSGSARLHRTHLSLTADRAWMRPTPQTEIELTQLKADIDDIEGDALLTVSGQTRAPGESYLSLIRTSPLSAILDHLFDDAQGSGTWSVPLSLTIPLLDPEATRVDGEVVFDGASLQLAPRLPRFEQIRGRLHFADTMLAPRPGFSLRVLGSPASLTGSLGHGAPGLVLDGRLAVKSLAGRVPASVMKRVRGDLRYRLRMARDERGYRLAFESDLKGLALDFPAPLAKPADQARPLQLIWSNRAAREDTLAIDLGTDLSLRLHHRRGATTGPYFNTVSVGVGRAAPPADALSVSLIYPLLDLDAWYGILQEVLPAEAVTSGAKAGTGSKKPTAAHRPLFPPLHALSLQVDLARFLGSRLDQLALRLVHQPSDGQWSLNLRSVQTTGTLKWRVVQGRVQGHVSGRFDRLSLGDPDEGADSSPQAEDRDLDVSDDLDIPAIILQVDDLRLYGHPVGRLTLDGVRQAAGGNWRLDSLALGTDDARLVGTGLWRLRGQDRGLNLKAKVTVNDLGNWMDSAGFKNILHGGRGTLDGTLHWTDFPWTYQKSALQAQLNIALDKGRFSNLGSVTAKLLELLSIQSISRLGRLDQGLAGLTKEGFPFDQLRGQVQLADGVARAKDYKVIGPVGTILLEGDTDIVHETLDLQAAIVPNLDVSGAAIAAGIAINPLVGIGAFLSQLLLKDPLAKAMAARYRVTGTWDDPKVEEVNGKTAATNRRP